MAEMNDFYGTPGVTIKGPEEVLEDQKQEQQDALEAEAALDLGPMYDNLTGHVINTFETNRNARRESGIEQDMIDDLYQVSSRYRPKDIEDISGSNIFMGITSTKQRAGTSWIRDILMPANTEPFEVVVSTDEDVPPGIKEMIYEAFAEDEERLSQEIEKKFAELSNPQPQVNPQTGQEEPIKLPPSALITSKKLKEISKLRRDVEESIVGEIHKVASHEVRKLNREVSEQLRSGGFEKALEEFLDDFTTFPTAFMKGPIVTTDVKLVWKDGIPFQEESIVYRDMRMNPLDAYPSPGASSLYDGDFIEHVRITRKDLSAFAKLDSKTGYKKDNIVDILLNDQPGQPFWASTDIEEDKALVEKRGSQTYANEGIYHGLHFWGSISVGMLEEWGMQDLELIGREEWEELEVEILVVNTKVIKCRINKDPLKRRPYYAASFIQRSGSIWGLSLPNRMRDIQGMCNAAARALADNMGMASGPQVSILVDRLADDGEIEEQEPFKVWQFRSDPQGNGGKPIEYFIAPSNAQELLAVYENFEVKADDVTGIPRYAYGNERTGGASQTASGLSMLLESASKGIKSSLMNIAKGLIIPRVEYQCYMHLLQLRDNNDDFKFNGDLNVVVKAVENITIQAAQQQLRKELLQVTSNPQDVKIMGYEGRGLLLREIFKDVGLPEDVIPDRLELKELQAKEDDNAQKLVEAQAQAGDKSVEATKVQIEGQERMHQGTLQLQQQQMEKDAQEKEANRAIELSKIQQRDIESTRREASRIQEANTKAATTIGVEATRRQFDETDKGGTADTKAES